MFHVDGIVFGPIHSRRLGNSLGINILPPKGKTCNFDCVYCECGWNKDGAVSGRRFPTLDQVQAALSEAFEKLSAAGTPVDSITMSGNGEPTLNPYFPQIVGVTLDLRDRYFPDAKVSVLSNASNLGRPGVLEAMKKIDNPILKIDAPTDDLVRMIDNPSSGYNIENVIENLSSFDGNFILQTMFLKSPDFDTTSKEALELWYGIVRRLRPREIMAYTIDRETPDKRLSKCTVQQMQEYVRPLVEEGFTVQVRG